VTSWCDDETRKAAPAVVAARLLVVVCALLALALELSGSAAASHETVPESPLNGRVYEHPCASLDTLCAALTERLEYMDNDLQTIANHTLNTDENTFGALAKLDTIGTNTAGGGSGGGGTQEVSGTVALSSSDRERADLQWWGTWAIVGLMFALLLAPRWFIAFRVTHGA
jgi:ABC-type phosphate transport system substrate-binding protein